MRTTLATLAALLLASTAAHAQQFHKNLHYSLSAGRTFAIRAVCPQYGLSLHAHLAGDWAATVGAPNGPCVNNRLGFSFTVPPGAATQSVELFVGWDWPPNPDLKIRLEPDCGGSAGTACALTLVWDPRIGDYTARAAGRFTWPGDEDWYRIDETRTSFE
jgi:hypothetical protein